MIRRNRADRSGGDGGKEINVLEITERVVWVRDD